MQVFSARFEGRHGEDDTRVFATRAAAIAWRDEIAANLWAYELGRYPGRSPGPDDADKAADEAFEFSESYFYLAKCHVEGLPASSPEYLAHFPEEARPYADAAYQDGFVDGAESERERIAAALDCEAEVTPCAEDAVVTRDCARLVRADFSYDEAERLSEAEG